MPGEEGMMGVYSVWLRPRGEAGIEMMDVVLAGEGSIEFLDLRALRRDEPATVHPFRWFSGALVHGLGCDRSFRLV